MLFSKFTLSFCIILIVSTIRGDGGRDAGTTAPPPVTEIVQPVPTETEPPPTRGPIGKAPPITPRPPPIEGCALSPNPVQENEKTVGYRFGESVEIFCRKSCITNTLNFSKYEV